MFDSTCIFCKIIQEKASRSIIKEDEFTLVIPDIAPKAPIHYLIFPKKHIISLLELTDADAAYGWHMLKMARDLGNNLSDKAFNLVSNNGTAAGQSVFHVHLHLLSGKNLYEHGLKL